MVRDFLQVANLKMTAISLTEEAGEMDGAALAADSQGTSMTLSLVYLLRYFGMPSVRQQAQETMVRVFLVRHCFCVGAEFLGLTSPPILYSSA